MNKAMDILKSDNSKFAGKTFGVLLGATLASFTALVLTNKAANDVTAAMLKTPTPES